MKDYYITQGIDRTKVKASAEKDAKTDPNVTIHYHALKQPCVPMCYKVVAK